MKFEQYKKPSIFLILLATVILGLGLLMAFLLHRAEDDLKDDVRIINEAGIVRGSIQRLTKLALSDSGQSTNEIRLNINRRIEQFSLMEKENRNRELEASFFKDVRDLKEKWHNLERSLIAYQKTQSEQVREKILKKVKVAGKQLSP